MHFCFIEFSLMIMFWWDETIERGKQKEQGKEYKRESKENKGEVIRKLKTKMQDGGRQKVAQEEEQDGGENILRE